LVLFFYLLPSNIFDNGRISPELIKMSEMQSIDPLSALAEIRVPAARRANTGVKEVEIE